MTSPAWRKSSYSGGNAQNCVEVAGVWRRSGYEGRDGAYAGQPESTFSHGVRDSRTPESTELFFAGAQWAAFLAPLKREAF
ncbi:DUF397 domain-containing protein [Salinactinospora qingdaonensis]|uniref:DUF397 domain-containing protein n=1 Tax=Salinactinospora qingdaonensis TaxID=702744 RepID=A0ABP7FDJ9_9ACTN